VFFVGKLGRLSPFWIVCLRSSLMENNEVGCDGLDLQDSKPRKIYLYGLYVGGAIVHTEEAKFEKTQRGI
jgi:hypothetical protein